MNSSKKEDIIRLHSEGKSYSEIQALIGCSKGTISYHLGDGQKDKTRLRTKRSRTLSKRELWEYKEKQGCKDCREFYPHYMLDFDHLPGFSKVGSPTELIHKYSKQLAWSEIEKCDVVCKNCHGARTWTRYLATLPDNG